MYFPFVFHEDTCIYFLFHLCCYYQFCLQTPLQIAKIPPKPMIALVVFGSSAAFCTPIGTSCNMLVAGPGKYSFMDFVKNGALLQVVAMISSVSVVYVWSKMLEG